jgi:threonine/homoserine/homoserine lactone efflux protein
LLLGILFALAFCPTSGVFYFGMLMPMAAAETGGYLLPVVFALATGLPVIVVAWILAYSIAGLGKFYNRIQVFQKWFNRVVAVLFIVVGIYYAIINYL